MNTPPPPHPISLPTLLPSLFAASSHARHFTQVLAESDDKTEVKKVEGKGRGGEEEMGRGERERVEKEGGGVREEFEKRKGRRIEGGWEWGGNGGAELSRWRKKYKEKGENR